MVGAVRAGRLNRRVTILRRGAGSDDGYGKVPGAWQVLCARDASIKPARRNEVYEAAGTEGKAELTCWLRHDSVTRTIAETDAVVEGGRLYEIAATPMEVGNREGIELRIVAGDGGAVPDVDDLEPWTAP
ncbi:SPP1 family predicted phage head-tail adaptor [Novosphingobium kunmingense]|uniref:SPP1 family predicted phage head-tail adaptor n=1 Tax=Novosphingobium kunmingense TaxID=1211806 RepID=A0A2N0HL20_9SPHN|nr:phage head closure protein [Novosphingobium kunmingense]PKB19654.1 SPP1 family predicted phage head-tail adaptor [Novosphingobium kunmingense]